MKNHLGIGMSSKHMPACKQFLAQFDVVEDLTVKGDPHTPVFVAQGLVTAAEIDDAQPGMGQPDTGVGVNAPLIRTAMPDHGNHSLQHSQPDGHCLR
jgi:hypothetical protein